MATNRRFLFPLYFIKKTHRYPARQVRLSRSHVLQLSNCVPDLDLFCGFVYL